MANQIIFHQLYEASSSTYTYLLGDPETKEAVLIDSVLETVNRDLKLISELGLKLKYVLDTHIHADHVTGAGEIRKITGAKSAVNAVANVPCVDISLKEGDTLSFGHFAIKAVPTPGHTDACMTFLCENMAFTGDTLLIRGTGRTDFQSGSASTLYDSITKKLFSLPADTTIYPAHDYAGFTHTTIETERQHNPRVGSQKTKEEFVAIMDGLNLAYPKKIDIALPANRRCGISPNIKEMSPAEVLARKDSVLALDVRSLEEFNGPLGSIPGAHRAALGEELKSFLEGYNRDEEIVFVCRSGQRSAEAVKLATELGFRKIASMKGGMEAWSQEVTIKEKA